MMSKKEFVELPVPFPFGKAYSWGALRIIVAKEPKVGWHMSISHPRRYPTWDEIKKARYTLCPREIDMAMFLPPESQFVNIHPNCFHLFEVKHDPKFGVIAGQP